MSNNFGLSKYSKLVLRLGLAFVFGWFGYTAFTNPEMFVGLVPAWTGSILPALTLIKIHGVFELVFAVLLLVGWKTRLVSGLLLLSLIGTIASLSYGPTMIRDIAIALALLSVFLEN